VVAGNVTVDTVRELAEKWFGDIPAGEKYLRNLPQEPEQKAGRKLEVKAAVPLDAFYKTWHMPGRLDKEYYAVDLLTDILGGGGSSRLYQALVKEKKLFSNIECYHFGSTENGLVAIEGKLVKGVDIKTAEKAVDEVIDTLRHSLLPEAELQKVKNKTESTIAFEDMALMNRANSLAYYEILGDASLMNTELEKYAAVTAADIQRETNTVFREANSNTIYYLSEN
jgi:predicted Zn-dependent peptidase